MCIYDYAAYMCLLMISHTRQQIRKYVHGGAIKYNESCDIWSLGAVMYAMVIADTSPAILATATPQALAKQVTCAHNYTVTCNTISLSAHAMSMMFTSTMW
jgi:hypothetical protein